MQLYKEKIQRQLAEGKTVKTPTGSFFLSAAGEDDTSAIRAGRPALGL
ncbi:MAG: hypothetical protein ABSF43_06025 [Rectinemataceae bacterium]